MLCRVGRILGKRNTCKQEFGKRTCSSVKSQLLNIPEFSRACEFERSGKFAQALPEFTRAKEVTINSTGSHSDFSAYVSLCIAKLHRHMGAFVVAEKSLSEYDSYSKSNKIRALLAISHNRLYAGSAEGALRAAISATEICESSQEPEYDLMHSCYSMQGLSHLYGGQYVDAEDMLQLAARWPQDAHSTLVSMMNLGYVHAVQCGWSPPMIPEQRSRDSLPNAREDFISRSCIEDAILHWQEAVDELLGNVGRTAMAAAPAATAQAMCGSYPGSSAVSGGMGPGEDALRVSPSSLNNIDEIAKEDPSVALQRQLEKDSFLAMTYSGVLCNIAEGSMAVGDSSKAAANITTALAALDPHADNPRCSPYMARCLYLIGSMHAYSMQAVTAEGLFRSALDKLDKSSFAQHSLRHQYQRARILRAYGALLEKWDKREKSGMELREQSEKILSALPLFHDGNRIDNFVSMPY